MMDTKKIRKFFPAIKAGRIVSNNAASTQIPIQLLDLQKKLAVQYDNVHRGQSESSLLTTKEFEASYDTIAQFIGAPSRKNIILYRNTTEAINSVMYSLLTEFKDGDNVVTTFMEHNSNYVPWYGLCQEILPKLGINVEYRIVKFDKETGLLDLEHMKSLVDKKTKLVCCTGASNFLGTINPIKKIKEIADAGGYVQPDGEKRAYLLIDGAQLVPNSFVDVNELGIDFLAWSFHKMMAPFGVGVLYAKEKLLEKMKPFLYGGDMIREVHLEWTAFNKLPEKFEAGTPDIAGIIGLGAAVDYLTNLGMGEVRTHEKELVEYALEKFKLLEDEDLVTVYGVKKSEERGGAIAFNVKGVHSHDVAQVLNNFGICVRSGQHCAAPLVTSFNVMSMVRATFYVYNTKSEIDYLVEKIKEVPKVFI